MSSPYKGEGRGIAMLNLLRTLSQSIAPSMADMWELEIPLLVKYLEGELPGVPPLCVPAGIPMTWLQVERETTASPEPIPRGLRIPDQGGRPRGQRGRKWHLWAFFLQNTLSLLGIRRPGKTS